MHHAGIRHLKQQTVCHFPPYGGRASSTDSTRTSPIVLKLLSGLGGGATWTHANRTDVCMVEGLYLLFMNSFYS